MGKLASHVGVGVPEEFFFDIVSDEVGRLYYQALKCAENSGATIRQVSIPTLSDTEEAGNHIAWAEATHYHNKVGWFPARAEDYGEDVRSRLEMGERVSAMTYLKALDTREKFNQQLILAMLDAKVDVLAVPTTPIVAPSVGEEATEIGKKNHSTRALLLRLNRPANLAGVPAISIPCGFTSGGLPVGLQLISLVTKERVLISVARFFENQTKRRPPGAL